MRIHELVESRETIVNSGNFKTYNELKEVSGKYFPIIKEYFERGNFIFRGSKHMHEDMMVIDANTIDRKSAYTRNYYTLLMDNLPEWDKFPKRSNSILATTSYNKADIYGDTYYVIPLDNQLIGICPDVDLWDSFDISRFTWSMGRFLSDLDSFSKKFGVELSEDDFKKFVNNIKYVEEKIQQYDKFPEEVLSRSFEPYFDAFKEGDFLEQLRNIFTPKNFRLETANKFLNDKSNFDNYGVELWFSGKSILLSKHVMDGILRRGAFR